MSCEGFDLFTVKVNHNFESDLNIRTGTAEPGMKAVNAKAFYEEDSINLGDVSELDDYRSRINEVNINDISVEVKSVNLDGVEFEKGASFTIHNGADIAVFTTREVWVIEEFAMFSFDDLDGNYADVTPVLGDLSGTIHIVVEGVCSKEGVEVKATLKLGTEIVASLF